MKIITSGSNYIDIDAYSGCVAYAELLRALGVEAQAVSTASPNASIPESYINSEDITLTGKYEASGDDRFILVDITNPDYIDTFVVEERVVAIFDHHTGFEDYWRDRIGDDAVIEFIGAACTLIFEEWEQAGVLDQMKPNTAKLLMAGILDNTLNFKAKITTDRDISAYNSLQDVADMGEDFARKYFKLCEAQLNVNVIDSLVNDEKIHRFQQVDFEVMIGQAVVWEGSDFIKAHKADIELYGQKSGSRWFVNVLSISDGCSYFVSESEQVQELVSRLFGVEFTDDVAKADRLWLRKEMFKHAGGQGGLG